MMNTNQSNNAGEGILAILIIIIQISAFIYTGKLAWDWVGPKSFWGAVQFCIVWSILESIAYFVIGGIAMLLFAESHRN